MRVLIFLLLFFTNLLNAQYNKIDTTWTYNYRQVLNIRSEIEKCKETRFLLQDEIETLIEKDTEKSIIIAKLTLKDSLYQQELDKALQIESIYKDKLLKSNEIMNNYKIMLLTTEDQLSLEARKARKEKLWKNIYKYSYPTIAIGIGTYLLLK